MCWQSQNTYPIRRKRDREEAWTFAPQRLKASFWTTHQHGWKPCPPVFYRRRSILSVTDEHEARLCTTLGEIQLSNDVMLESVVIDRCGALYGRDPEGTTSVVPIKLHPNHSYQLSHRRRALL